MRALSNQTGIKPESVRKILKADLKYKPFKIPIVQVLEEGNFSKCVEACARLLRMLDGHSRIKTRMPMTDQCIFTLDNTVSISHARYWSPTKPATVQQAPMQPARQLVWCGMTSQHVIGPYYFDRAVTAESFQEMLQNFVIPAIGRLRIMRTVLFQQDGAPTHTTHSTIDKLQRTFGKRVISRRCDIVWPARPYTTGVFLWGTLKLRIKQKQPRTMDEQKRYLEEVVAAINNNKAFLNSVFNNFVQYLQSCISNFGSHVLS